MGYDVRAVASCEGKGRPGSGRLIGAILVSLALSACGFGVIAPDSEAMSRRVTVSISAIAVGSQVRVSGVISIPGVSARRRSAITMVLQQRARVGWRTVVRRRLGAVLRGNVFVLAYKRGGAGHPASRVPVRVVVSGPGHLAARSSAVAPHYVALAAPAGACPGALLIGVRGSGETSSDGGGYGTTVQAVVQALGFLDPSVQSEPIDYQALAVRWYDPRYYGYRYAHSVGSGIAALLAHAQGYLSACPHRPLYLAGYSQGAQVVADTYQDWMSAAEQARVTKIVLFGDPKFKGSQGLPVSVGDYNSQLNGVAAITSSARSWPAGDAAKVRSYCASGDPVCNFASLGQAAGCGLDLTTCPHMHYMDAPIPGGGVTYAEAAAQFIAGSPAGSGVSIADPGAQSTLIGEVVDLPVRARGPAGRHLIVQASGLPAGLSYDPVGGAIIGSPTAAGASTVTLRVTAIARGRPTATTSFVWTVSGCSAVPQTYRAVSLSPTDVTASWPDYGNGPANQYSSPGSTVFANGHAPAIAWQTCLGTPAGAYSIRPSAPVVANGTVYLVTGGFQINGAPVAGSATLWAFDEATGHVRWTSQPGVIKDVSNVVPGALSTPVLAAGHLIVATEGGLQAFDAGDGRAAWSWAGDYSHIQTWEIPVASGNTVYVVGPTGDQLYALDASDGAQLWSAALPVGTPTDSQPLAVAGGQVFIGSCFGSLTAFDAATGTRQWTTNLYPPDQFNPVGTPVVFGSELAVAVPGHAVVAVNPSDGSVLWRTAVAPQGGPLVYSGGILAFEQGPAPGLLETAISPQTGAVIWSEPRRYLGLGLGAPDIGVGQTLFGFDGTWGSVVSVQALDPATGHVQWSTPFPVYQPSLLPVAARSALVTVSTSFTPTPANTAVFIDLWQ